MYLGALYQVAAPRNREGRGHPVTDTLCDCVPDPPPSEAQIPTRRLDK